MSVDYPGEVFPMDFRTDTKYFLVKEETNTTSNFVFDSAIGKKQICSQETSFSHFRHRNST